MTAPSPRDREIALLPCPFCGGEASFEEIKRSPEVSNWTVGCDERNDDDEILCYGYQSLTTFATKKEAAAAWNKRDARALAAARAEGMEQAALREALTLCRAVIRQQTMMDVEKDVLLSAIGVADEALAQEPGE